MRSYANRIKVYLSLLFIYFATSTTFAVTAKLMIENARLFTMADGQREPIKGYLVIADDGTIMNIGKGKPPTTIKAKKIVNAHGYWIMPGLISAHSHLWQAAYRGLAADKTLSGWINDLYFQRSVKAKPDDFYWFCLLGALDHLEHGITTAYNFNYGGLPGHIKGNAFDTAQFRAEQESGIRFIHGYQPDVMKEGSSIDAARTRLKEFLAWTDKQPPSSRFLSLMINGMTAFNTTYQQAVMEATLMQELHLGNQSHYLEPPETEKEEQAKFHWFTESGLLSNQLIFGHFIHTNDFILQQTGKAGASMSWNPLSNGRLASGVANIPKYLKMGIRVGMGVDGEASADLADPFENMRTGLYALRAKYEDATIMSPYQVLWLHTMGSADVLGVKDKIGSLEPGKFADFLVINPARLGAVLEDPYANLVLVTSERDIDQVYVGGNVMVEHNQVLGKNLGKIRAETNKRVSV